jgi:hypothetical protein
LLTQRFRAGLSWFVPAGLGAPCERQMKLYEAPSGDATGFSSSYEFVS